MSLLEIFKRPCYYAGSITSVKEEVIEKNANQYDKSIEKMVVLTITVLNQKGESKEFYHIKKNGEDNTYIEKEWIHFFYNAESRHIMSKLDIYMSTRDVYEKYNPLPLSSLIKNIVKHSLKNIVAASVFLLILSVLILTIVSTHTSLEYDLAKSFSKIIEQLNNYNNAIKTLSYISFLIGLPTASFYICDYMYRLFYVKPLITHMISFTDFLMILRQQTLSNIKAEENK